MKRIAGLAAAMCLLTACGTEADSESMTFIKSVELYQTITDMYAQPKNYLGKQFHMVGTLYPSTEADGDTFYSIYAKDGETGAGIGIELDCDSYDGLNDYDTVMVEGTLESTKVQHDDNEIEILILRVSEIEARN